MSIYIYSAAYNGTAYSQNGTFTNPINFKVAAPFPSSAQVQLFLRHNILSGPGAESSAGISVAPNDIANNDTNWIQIAPDSSGSPGTYGAAGASVSLGDVPQGSIVPFWAKITVPSGQPYGLLQTLRLALTATQTQLQSQTPAIALSNGSSPNNTVTYFTNSFTLTGTVNGTYLTAWIDCGGADTLFSFVSSYAPDVFVQFRSSPNADGSSASAWFDNVYDAGTVGRYIQFKFYILYDTTNTFGMTLQWYSDTSLSNLVVTKTGKLPYTSDVSVDAGLGGGQGNISARYTGQFYAGQTGTYSFRVDSDDGNRIYIDGSLVAQNWTTGGDQVSTYSTTFSAGSRHQIVYEYFQAGGGQFLHSLIQTPADTGLRAYTLNDFSPSFSTTWFNYSLAGPQTFYYDIYTYDGPDTPVFIGPTNNAITPNYQQILTVSTQNCDHIEFEMDTVLTFNSTNLQDWTVAVGSGGITASGDPQVLPVAGNWYWRARGILNGMVGAWMDPHSFILQASANNPEFLYMNASIGLASHDPIGDNRFFYLNSSIGLEFHDPTVDNRFIYVNVNVADGIGNIIYPIADNTIARVGALPSDQPF